MYTQKLPCSTTLRQTFQPILPYSCENTVIIIIRHLKVALHVNQFYAFQMHAYFRNLERIQYSFREKGIVRRSPTLIFADSFDPASVFVSEDSQKTFTQLFTDGFV